VNARWPRPGVTTIWQWENGKAAPRTRFRGVLACAPPRLAPDGRIVIGLNRYLAPKKPVLAIFHAETNEVTWVPPTMFDVRKDDQLEAYGVAKTWIWVNTKSEIRRVDWDTVLALPRQLIRKP
jgi:hypothetical protein